MEKVTLAAAAPKVEKHPELRTIYNKLADEKAVIVAKAAPLRARYEQLQQQIAPLEAAARALAKQFHAIERPRLGEIENQLGVLAKGMGGRALSDGGK